MLMALAEVISRMIVLRVRAARVSTPAGMGGERRPAAASDLAA